MVLIVYQYIIWAHFKTQLILITLLKISFLNILVHPLQAPSFLCFTHSYCKLVETFHNVSECKTVVYFVDGLHYSSGGQVIFTVAHFYIHATSVVRILATTIQCMWPGDLDRKSFGVASLLDRLRITLSHRDRTRLYETFIITIQSHESLYLKEPHLLSVYKVMLFPFHLQN